MNLYLTFDEYSILGGVVTDEDVYDKLIRKAQILIDYVTFNRIPRLPEIPESVKFTLMEFVDQMYEYAQADAETPSNIESYSNTVEKIEYRRISESKKEKELIQSIAYKYLPDYLTARGVNYDVGMYLQSKGNDT